MEVSQLEADIDSDAAEDSETISAAGPFFQTFTATPKTSGDTIDSHGETPVTVERKTRRQRANDEPGSARDAKATPPSLDEWSNFFSRVVLRVGTEFYINLAFRGIDEDSVSDRDLDRLVMTDEERKMIATPFAELSHKSKFMRKHGRMIVASGDALNALVVLGVWMGRVNRIASKYRPKVVKGSVNGHGNNGQDTQAPIWEGSSGGRFPPGFDGGFTNPGTG